MTIRLMLIVSVGVLFFSCSKKTDTRSSEHSLSVPIDSCIQSEEYAVLSCLLDSSYADSDEIKTGVTMCMLIDSTIPPRKLPERLTNQDLSSIRKQLPSLEIDSLLKHFTAINARTAVLVKDSLKCHLNVILIRGSVLDSVYGGTIGTLQNWPLFYKQNPHTRGLAQLSRVAFNNSRNQAAVYWEREREPLIGFGELVFLMRQVHGWAIAARDTVWIS